MNAPSEKPFQFCSPIVDFIDIEEGIRNKEFRLEYQGIYDASTLQRVGSEALVRWQHPKHGLLMPAFFIPQSESNGTIYKLGREILAMACRDAAALRVPVNVNVSPIQLVNGFARTAREQIEASRVPAGMVTLEITESYDVALNDEYLLTLSELHSSGVTLAIDDFGMGHTSLRLLRSGAFSCIKIDQSVIHGLSTSIVDIATVEAIMALANRLKLKVVAEGVENDAQLTTIRRYGVHYAQGYLLDGR